MNKLLQAALYRLRIQKAFWILLGAALLCGIAFGAVSVFENEMDGTFVTPLFLLMGIYVSLSVGQEFHDATIRNKVIAGNTKGAIFVAELIINAFVCLIMMLLFLLPALICCYSRLLYAVPIEKILFSLLCFLLAGVLYAVIFTLISCLISQKAIASVLCVLLVFALTFCAYRLEFSIFQVESITLGQETDAGEIVSEEVIPNPAYVGGVTRKIFVAADSIIPNGQVNNLMTYLCSASDGRESSELQTFCEETLPYYPLYSIVWILVLSCVGWLVFRKKELK